MAGKHSTANHVTSRQGRVSLIGGDVGTTEEGNVGVGIQALQSLLVFITFQNKHSYCNIDHGSVGFNQTSFERSRM